MFRSLTTFAVAATLGVFAGGELYAQSEPQSTPGTSAQSSAPPQAEQGQQGAAARERLLEARESLAEVAKMPEASQLQGQARTDVAQAITNFNALLTAEANWYDQYKLVMQNLYNVLGSPSAGESAAGTSGTATGTTGSATAGSSDQVPSALRSKLAEFRQKLMAFGREAGAPDVNGGVTGPGTPGTSGTSTSTAGTSGTGTSGTGTSGTSTSGTSTSGTSTSGTSTSGTSGTSSTSSYPQSQPSSAAEAETLEQHIDAIHDIIQQAMTGSGGASATGTSATGSTSGTASPAGTGSTAGTAGSTSSMPGVVTIDREKLDRIQSHLQRMREIARAKGIK